MMRGTIDCRYWSANPDSANYGFCGIHRFNGTPSIGGCTFCLAHGGSASQGLGDTVAKVIHTVTGGTINGDCPDCPKRQAALNKALPYKAKDT